MVYFRCIGYIVLVKYVICHTVTLCYMVKCYPNKWNQCCCKIYFLVKRIFARDFLWTRTFLYDMRWSRKVTHEIHQMLRLPRKVTHELHQMLRLPRKTLSWVSLLSYETSFTVRGATGITLQPQQILRLPRKMNLMIDPHHIWNVIYNARSNRHHPPTSPNTAPAKQNECHDWSFFRMKRHLQCAEQQASPSNLTKYCACHAKWISWLIRITYETSFTMRGATGITLQPHQILRLPRKMNLMIDPHHIWNVIYNARSNRHHPPTSPNTAPAKQNECHDWSASHMKRHLQCAKLQASHSNLTKHCACHPKWISWLIRITYETPFTMRGATGINLQPHQILRLPRKRNVMIDPHHIWNVIYNARSNRHQSPTSPNTAPTTQNCTPKS